MIEGETLGTIGMAVGVFGLLIAFMLYRKVDSIEIENKTVAKITERIQDGAMAFMVAEYRMLAVFIAIVAALLFAGGSYNDDLGMETTVAFVIGALCSGAAGFSGMKSATSANGRTAQAAASGGQAAALTTSYNGGAVMGLAVGGLGLFGISLMFYFTETDFLTVPNIAGFGMGASSIALFARVGGGIYTKAADVGADLVGKVEAGIPEDDPRNPGVIADNVGDNVGDVAGMGKIYKYLGLSVGVITSDMDISEKKEQYSKDIVYGTNNEFGFDYLRDNMVYSLSDKVQGKLSYAIVDEVDSVLIDEARTPLIISGSANKSTNLYQKVNKLAQLFIKNNINNDFYIIDEKQKNVSLTENGHAEIESLLSKNKYIDNNDNLYNPKNIQLLQIFNSSLRANLMYQVDIDYVVENDAVVIIDEFSGRKMSGRRWSEGLHQSIEAKENVSIQNENQTYASITFQNYFRLFNKLSGMTGTADTEALEFQQIYNLEVVVLPTHMKMIRNDHVDLIYLTSDEKYNAILESIIGIHQKEQPVLVGTTSIEASEYLSKLLKKQGVAHSVLNAKHHQKEAEIIAQAGKLGAVTIATNMAGRGTDIVLGGKIQDSKVNSKTVNEKDKVKNLGGLYIIGT